jgi:hypothetical protein
MPATTLVPLTIAWELAQIRVFRGEGKHDNIENIEQYRFFSTD